MEGAIILAALLAWTGFVYWLGYGDGRVSEQEKAIHRTLDRVMESLRHAS